MGSIRCKRHGQGGTLGACAHVFAAREEDRPIDLIEAESLFLVWICRECEALFERALATGARDETVMRRHHELDRLGYWRCMHEWRERHALSARRSDVDLDRLDRDRS